ASIHSSQRPSPKHSKSAVVIYCRSLPSFFFHECDPVHKVLSTIKVSCCDVSPGGNKMRLVQIVVATVVTFVSSAAMAWNNRGHMMIAAVAWEQLEEGTQQRATELLKLNPNYKDWVKGVSRTDYDKTAFMKASTWPDFIRAIAKKPEAAGPDDYVDDGSD